MSQKTCEDGNADNCPGCWQCFEEAVEANHRADVVKILCRRGMKRAVAQARVQQLDLADHGDKTAAQLAEFVAGPRPTVTNFVPGGADSCLVPRTDANKGDIAR